MATGRVRSREDLDNSLDVFWGNVSFVKQEHSSLGDNRLEKSWKSKGEAFQALGQSTSPSHRQTEPHGIVWSPTPSPSNENME